MKLKNQNFPGGTCPLTALDIDVSI